LKREALNVMISLCYKHSAQGWLLAEWLYLGQVFPEKTRATEGDVTAHADIGCRKRM
jgi:hypothetical protein